MFSKFGKICQERFQILKHREEILSGRSPRKSPRPQAPRSKSQQLSPEKLQEILRDSIVSDSPQNKSPPKQSYAFMSQTRDEFYKANGLKSPAPPCNHYDARYELVDKQPRKTDFRERPKTASRVRNQSKISDLENIPERPRTKLKGAIPLDKQLPRPSIVKMTNDVNEKRFEHYEDMPVVLGKYKRVSTPDIAKSKPRDDKFLHEDVFPTYDTSYKLVSDDLGKVANFDKYSPRKPILLSHLTNMHGYKVNYGMVERRVSSPDFKKVGSRPESASPLPIYMQKINSRASLNILSEKMLEMNSALDISRISLSGSPVKLRSPNLSMIY
ncbi:unnamed protein product [Blepharisma stoltei]|uniref:Uncharacterized protein n=1 Tax=Blepharisma stoltei TaxID=1481888 RepID=A0AAU9IH00_9CILI|nr:unnamed protein product [Blepharisma stoltei]